MGREEAYGFRDGIQNVPRVRLAAAGFKRSAWRASTPLDFLVTLWCVCLCEGGLAVQTPVLTAIHVFQVASKLEEPRHRKLLYLIRHLVPVWLYLKKLLLVLMDTCSALF